MCGVFRQRERDRPETGNFCVQRIPMKRDKIMFLAL